MINHKERPRQYLNFGFLYTILSILIIGFGTYLAIAYAKGSFRFGKEGMIAETGLLSANSFPSGAQIFINGKLTSATDDTLYLEPGDYNVEIKKEGYSPWKKALSIQKELVSQTNALLFPTVPRLTPLSISGAENITTSPDGRKIVYYTASASSELKNGLYLLDMTNNLNPLQKTSRQLTTDNSVIDLTQAKFIWSPDSTELMIIDEKKEVLLDINLKNDLAELPDISFQRKRILSSWEEEMYLRERQFLSEFPDEIIQIATTSAKNVYISPDKKRLLYTATENFTLKKNMRPPLPASSTQKEDRDIIKGGIYLYDGEEDKNFKIAESKEKDQSIDKILLAIDLFDKAKTLEASPTAFSRLQDDDLVITSKNFSVYHSSLYINTLQWFPDSRHIIFNQDGNVKILEYDGTNLTVLYSGPFNESFVYPWPDGSKVVILTSFSPDSPENLYAIELK